MTELFQRTCSVTINKLKLTGHAVAFKVEKTLKPEPNSCWLEVRNLNEDHRAELEELKPKKKGDIRGIPVKIEAGYQGDEALLWLGDLRTVTSLRDGPDWVTTLESGDGEKAIQNARIHQSFGPKTPVDTALRAIVRTLGVGEGNLGQVVHRLKVNGFGKLLPHGTVLSGSASRELTDFCKSADLEWSVQDGAIQFVDRGKVLAGKAIRLSADTGMIGSPSVDNDGVLTVQSQLIPDVRVGGLLVLDADRIKGGYRIVKATWSGDTHGGDWTITMEAKRY